MTEELKEREAERRRVTRAFAKKEEWEQGSSLTGSKMVIGMLTACTVVSIHKQPADACVFQGFF